MRYYLYPANNGLPAGLVRVVADARAEAYVANGFWDYKPGLFAETLGGELLFITADEAVGAQKYLDSFAESGRLIPA